MAAHMFPPYSSQALTYRSGVWLSRRSTTTGIFNNFVNTCGDDLRPKQRPMN